MLDAAPATLMFAKFSPAGAAVAYVQGQNIYVHQVSDNHITALTSDGSVSCFNGTGDWVNEEELGIRDGFRWSPDGQSIAFWQFDTAGVPLFHLIDNAAELYPRITSFPYPKVGQTNSAVRIGIVSVRGGEVRWLALPGDPRQHYVSALHWMPDSAAVFLQQLNRLQNKNRVFLADARQGTVQLLMTEQDAAWVESNNNVTLIRNGQAFLWMSERDGWDHLYLVNRDGSSAKLLTPGNYDVLAIEAFDSVNNWVYFSASPDNPTQRYLYRVHVDGGPAQRLSPISQPGWHTYGMSPDARWAIHTYSTFSTPPVVSLITLSDHGVAHVFPDQVMLQEKIGTLAKPQSSFFKIAIHDEVTLDGWRICPPNFDPKRTYPVLFYVYGEPAGQSVRDSWGGSSGLWHWMLAQRGYIVISVDPRGTNVPRGRAWRKSIYRQIGVIAPEDIAAAIRALIKQWEFIDPKRIGVWGWSGGGSNTLHAIFRFPDLFSTAIAVAPNANQLLYDTIYQERYMGLPDDNAEGYRLGSPITYAAQLRGNLLLVHGTGDDNGHYQGTEQLMNLLIAQHKHFTVMPYPARSHAISEGDNTVPHFYNLMTRYLDEHLMPVSTNK